MDIKQMKEDNIKYLKKRKSFRKKDIWFWSSSKRKYIIKLF